MVRLLQQTLQLLMQVMTVVMAELVVSEVRPHADEAS